MPMTQEDINKYKTLYLQAARDNVQNLETNIAQLLQGVESEELYETMHREAHSLKSESLLMGYATTGELAATIEQIFEQRKETNTSLSRDMLSLIEQSVKKLFSTLSEIEKNSKELDMSEQTNQLKALANL